MMQDSGLTPGIPLLLTRENHDAPSDGVPFAPSKRLHGPRAITVSDLRIISLDTSGETDGQVEWFRKELEKAVVAMQPVVVRKPR